MGENALAPGYGERLSQFIHELGLTSQADFALWAETTESQVSKWTREEITPRRGRVLGWAKRTTAPDAVYRWLVSGAERPVFRVNSPVYETGIVAERSVGYGSLAARLRALADEVEKLERAATSRPVEPDAIPPFGHVLQERKVQAIEQAAARREARRRKKQG